MLLVSVSGHLLGSFLCAWGVGTKLLDFLKSIFAIFLFSELFIYFCIMEELILCHTSKTLGAMPWMTWLLIRSHKSIPTVNVHIGWPYNAAMHPSSRKALRSSSSWWQHAMHVQLLPQHTCRPGHITILSFLHAGSLVIWCTATTPHPYIPKPYTYPAFF